MLRGTLSFSAKGRFMTPAEITNERIKLLATYLNGLAIAMATAGVFGPIISYIYGIIPSANFGLVLLSTGGCFIFSAGIHYLAQTLLEDLL
jgi:hypothetical protein